MMIRVRYFAAARELAGRDQELLQLPADHHDVTSVWNALCEKHVRLLPYRHRMRLAVNDVFADADTPVQDGDEVAVLPPVAGGAPKPLCGLREDPLSVDEVIRAVQHPSAGGIALFLGTVRDHAGDKAVIRLDYEAHPTMAAKEFERILDELEQSFPTARIAALHRVGELAIGELAVAVAASAPHRAEAFAACREAIERIKARVPIWKREWSPDAEAVWVNLDP